METRHLRFLELAIRQANKAKGFKRKFGAVIVRGRKIVAQGFNKFSHPDIPTITNGYGEKYYSLHAEINALLHMRYKIKGTIVYIHGMSSKNGHIVHSGPCNLCRVILKNNGVEHCIYSTKDGYKEEAL